VSPPAAVERPLRIAVVGGAGATDVEYEMARAVGEELARAGAVVVCGGHGGVMEAVARGAAAAGGWTVGILRTSDARDANPWIHLPLPTGLGDARNALVVASAEAVVAVGGAWGTLSEIALARKRRLAVAILGAAPAQGLDLTRFEDPVEAARWAVERARACRETAHGAVGRRQ
jgi:uncharacterized protein (TIGR00725 family)